MRIEGGGRGRAGEGGDPAARFGDALARAGGAGSGHARAERAARERAMAAAARGAGTNYPPVPGEEARTAAAGVDARAPGAAAELTPEAGLARALRVIPPAAALLGPAGGAPLTLSFGRSLDVDLRATSLGVDVVLRPEPVLARAAEAEVPRLVAALRVRGLAVARVEVRPRTPSGGRSR